MKMMEISREDYLTLKFQIADWKRNAIATRCNLSDHQAQKFDTPFYKENCKRFKDMLNDSEIEYEAALEELKQEKLANGWVEYNEDNTPGPVPTP
jgi:hypothetical protein